MILIQTYQELFYALKVLQILKESDNTLYKRLYELIANQIERLA